MLALGILFVRPELQLPAFTRFVDGTGPDLRRQDLSRSASSPSPAARSPGFHSLISSGTTPKMIAREWHALAGRLRLDAARELRRHHGDDRRLRAAAGRLLRGELAGGRRGRDAGSRRRDHQRLGLSGDASTRCARWPSDVGEKTLFCRTGGAPSLALGMAHIFAQPAAARRCSASGTTSRSCSRRCSS